MSGTAAAAAGLVGVLAAIGLWNAASYPPAAGYDADAHVEYAELLTDEHRFPTDDGRSEYYTPPLFYVVAGLATRVGERLGLGQPLHVAQALNALYAAATAVLTFALARLLRPGRRTFALAAVAYVAFLPVLAKTAAMFHPETLSLLLSTGALYVAARMLVRGRYRLADAAFLGVLLGAGQLVRAFSLWTFAVVVLALLTAAFLGAGGRAPVLRALAVMVVATAVVAGPWYVHQAVRYTNPVFDRPQPHEPLWERRPPSFYLDPGLPEIFSRPYRPALTNLAGPQTYAELWGDWAGAFAWNPANGPPDRGTRRELQAQSLLGVAPTLLAVGGWLLILAASLRRRTLARAPAQPLVALLPLAGLAGYLYFAVSYPTPDGDVLKATYLLTTAPAWALAFAYALDRLPRRALVPAAALLAASALADLRFLVYGSPLGGLL